MCLYSQWSKSLRCSWSKHEHALHVERSFATRHFDQYSTFIVEFIEQCQCHQRRSSTTSHSSPKYSPRSSRWCSKYFTILLKSIEKNRNLLELIFIDWEKKFPINTFYFGFIKLNFQYGVIEWTRCSLSRIRYVHVYYTNRCRILTNGEKLRQLGNTQKWSCFSIHF